MENKKIILGLILSALIILSLVGMIYSLYVNDIERAEKSIALPSITKEVLNRLSYEERNFLEESIIHFSDEDKFIVERSLSKISEEERVTRMKKTITLINETNRYIKEKNLRWTAGLTPISLLSDLEKEFLCGIRDPTEEEQRRMDAYPITIFS